MLIKGQHIVKKKKGASAVLAYCYMQISSQGLRWAFFSVVLYYFTNTYDTVQIRNVVWKVLQLMKSLDLQERDGVFLVCV